MTSNTFSFAAPLTPEIIEYKGGKATGNTACKFCKDNHYKCDRDEKRPDIMCSNCVKKNKSSCDSPA
ncbi:hypothetical protein SCHPADRAFT_898623 [Schizopora paradoxa]|uniref:Zn(2)-C6 fungal-type domain-containing protein n=1 Tax=Schizopora paradoxa TaxID=27342 RepID=A0A0H2S637_9AGAM|nr:hypothetical protein SCHPADRAFT_898623 [Schizopora paradoxa]